MWRVATAIIACVLDIFLSVVPGVERVIGVCNTHPQEAARLRVGSSWEDVRNPDPSSNIFTLLLCLCSSQIFCFSEAIREGGIQPEKEFH